MKILLYPTFLFLFQKLKTRCLFSLSCSAFLILHSPLLFSNPHGVQNQTGVSEYTCKVDHKCLNYLNNVLLNKETDRGIYKYCEANLDHTRLCCADPSQCQAPWGRNFAQDLRESSLEKVQNSGGDLLSCKLNQLSGLISSLSEIQSKACNAGLKNCQMDCENKLKEITHTFRQCFSISNSYPIEKVLEKINHHHPSEQVCYQKIQELVEKYKKQSLDAKFLFRGKLEAKDIINCEEIKNVQTESSLNNFALSMCHQAQVQKENEKKDTTAEEKKAEKKGVQTNSVSLKAEKSNPLPSALKKNHLKNKAQNTNSHLSRPVQEVSKNRSGKERPLSEPKALSVGASSGSGYGGAFNKKAKSGSTTDNVPSPLNQSPSGIETTKTLPPRTFFGKVSNSIKTFFGGITARIRGAFRAVEKKTIKHVHQRKYRKEGHVQITHQLVYQSVAAPQVEPFRIQEPQNNPEAPIFKSYDLVKGKPAGVLIQIQYQFPRHCFQNTNPYECIKQRDFNLKLEVKNQFVSTRCVPLKKIAKNDWQFDNSRKSSNRTCSFSTRDFSFEEPVIYKFVELDTRKIESVELEKYIKLDAATNIGEHYGIEQTSFSRSEDQTIMPINTENSHIPVRVNIVEGGKVIENEFSVKPNAESKVSLGNCGNNIDLNSANEFCLNVLELEGLNLGFTRITGDYNRDDKEDKENKKHDDCYLPDLTLKDLNGAPNGYPDVSPEQVMRLIESREATTFLPSLLPLSRLHASVLMTKRGSKNFILGDCDNGEVSKEFLNVMPQRSGSSRQGYKGGEGASPFSGKYFTYGLLKDIRNLKMERAEWRGKGKYDKLFAVVSKNYFLYHKLHKSLKIPRDKEIYGFSLTPVFRETLRDSLLIFNHDDHPWSFLGDVAFIREDRLDAGTLSHELAHLLGQRKDFYETTSPDCRPFQGIPLKVCADYKIPKALETWIEKGRLSWSFIKDRFSIMDNRQDIEQLWIDRESHQRVFSVMAKVSRVIQEKKWQQNPQLGYLPQNSILKKILVAGFYHKERDKFIVPQIKTLETTLSTPSHPEQPVGNGDYLTLLLRDEKENKTLQKIIRPVYKTHLGFLHQKEHSNKTSCKAVPFDFSYLHAAFDIPEYKNLEDLQIVVLGLKGNEIFSSYVLKEE